MVKRYRASSLPNQRISPERQTLSIARYKELKSLRAVANELKISRNVFFLQEFDVLSGVHYKERLSHWLLNTYSASFLRSLSMIYIFENIKKYLKARKKFKKKSVHPQKLSSHFSKKILF